MPRPATVKAVEQSFTFFRDPRLFSPMSIELSCVIATLNNGRSGDTGASVHAGSRGYSIKVGGRVVAKGATPTELQKNFKAEVDKAVAAARNEKK